jgi:hypothetical protein
MNNNSNVSGTSYPNDNYANGIILGKTQNTNIGYWNLLSSNPSPEVVKIIQDNLENSKMRLTWRTLSQNPGILLNAEEASRIIQTAYRDYRIELATPPYGRDYLRSLARFAKNQREMMIDSLIADCRAKNSDGSSFGKRTSNKLNLKHINSLIKVLKKI